MSGGTLTDWMYEVATRFDFSDGGPGDASPVRPPEVISGASGAQTSTGENTDQSVMEAILDRSDVVDELRENATENDRRLVSSDYEGGSHPMQSPNLARGEFALRYGIGFLCFDYEGEDEDLPDVEDMSQKSSLYLAAFRGLAKTKHYENPTAREIVATIQTWVVRLGQKLAGRGQAELVVSFQGHGERGNVVAVDGVEVTSAKLLAIAKKAVRLRVSITYVLDACYSGNAVPRFQDHAADVVEGRIQSAVAEADGVCSTDNEERANALRSQMAHARELIRANAAVGYLASVASDCFDRLEAEPGDDETRATLEEVKARILQRVEQTERQFLTNFDVGTPGMRFDEVAAVFGPTRSYLGALDHGTSFDRNEWASVVGDYQDAVSDGANRVIVEVDARIRALSR